MLDPGDPNHLWLLHVLFLNDIDEDCQVFRDEWNCLLLVGAHRGLAQRQTQCLIWNTVCMITNLAQRQTNK